jgi:hypothetical protein
MSAAPADPDVLDILGRVPQLADAQLWEIVHRCRVFRARADEEDQTVDVEISRDHHGRWLVIARDEQRGLTAQGVPMPGLNGAVQLVPWYVLDDAADTSQV